MGEGNHGTTGSSGIFSLLTRKINRCFFKGRDVLTDGGGEDDDDDDLAFLLDPAKVTPA